MMLIPIHTSMHIYIKTHPYINDYTVQRTHATHALEVFAVDNVVLLVDSSGANTAAKNVLLAVVMSSLSQSWWVDLRFELRVTHVGTQSG